MRVAGSGMPRARTLGAALRHARKRSGLSLREAAQQLGLAHSTVGRWESGDSMPAAKDVATLLAVLNVHDAERDEIAALTRDSAEGDWLASGPTGMSQQLAGVMECERSAKHVTEWSPMVIPGFLQTSDYARAIISPGREGGPEADTLVMLRMGRRDLFMRPEPAEVVALIAEPVIHGGIGGPKVMRDQLRHLLAMSKHDTLTVQLVDVGGDWHPGHDGPFIRYRYRTRPPIVYLEHYRSGAFLSDEAHVTAYEGAVDMIRRAAMSPEESLDRVAEVLAEMEKEQA
ncbi:MAG: helix-turn-helix transcriptional regulator [Kibdelosporangium sp.]